MTNPVEAIFVLLGACFAAGAIGGSFVLGVALVCRWLKWAPINTTINVYGPAEARFDDAVSTPSGSDK